MRFPNKTMKTIRQIIQVSVVTLFVLSMSVYVEAMTGNKLMENCEKYDVEVSQQDYTETGYCAGYITGTIYGMGYFISFLDYENRFCMPTKNLQHGQMVKVVIKYLKDNPQRLHENYTHLIFSAVSEAFPCK